MSGAWLTTTRQDLRHGWRHLQESPSRTAAAILVLALGMGTSTAVRGVVDALWLKPLPYPDPARLVLLWESHRHAPASWRLASLNAARAWRDEVPELERVAWSHVWRPVLDGAEPRSLAGARVSASFFAVLGVEPALGRAFSSEDTRPGAEPVVVLSYDLWQREWGGDPEVLGRLVAFEGAAGVKARVVGILPRGAGTTAPVVFEPAEIWTALIDDDPGRSGAGQRFYRVVGRLAEGYGLEQAGRRLAAVDRRLAEEHPETQDGWAAAVESLREAVVSPRRPALSAMVVAAAGVFLVALLNVALLLEAGLIARRQEFAVRAALGASPPVLGRQRFLENLLLAGAGSMLGAALAFGGVRPGLKQALGPWLVGWDGTIDGRALVFMSALTVLTAAALAVSPAVRSAVRCPGSVLGREPSHGGRGRFGRGLIVAIQVALSFVLLVTAALLGRSFEQLSRVDPGFDSRNVLTVELRIPRSLQAEASGADRSWELLLEGLGGWRHVTSAALVNHLPMAGRSMSTQAVAAAERHRDPTRVDLRGVSPGYFHSMGIPRLAGRDFASGGPERPGVVVSEAAARALWGDGETAAVGRRLILDWETREPYEVLGVVADVRHDSLGEAARPAVYLPLAQVPQRSLTLVLRSSADPEVLANEVRGRIHEIDRALVVEDVRTLAAVVEATMAPRRGYTLILAALAIGTLLLVVAATSGIVAGSVARRRRELGVRLALGASPARLVRMVVVEALRGVVAGVAAGVVASALVAKLLSGLLFGVGANDPPTLALASVVMLATGFVAAYWPARRAAKADPALTLGA